MRVKYLQPERRLYTEHLEIKQKQILNYSLTKELPSLKATQHHGLETNFAITIKNQYAFILLHLKKTQLTKNMLSINIPDICIFHNHLPYQILYNEGGEIRASKGKEAIRLRQIYTFFKNRWKTRALGKQEPCVACFDKQEYLMMSDTDLFITCRKFRNDPFFGKLAYIRSKVNSADNPIKAEYDQINDAEFTGLATESLMGVQDEKEILKKMGERNYLRYCNAKICLYLNYEHNIRVHTATFQYLKNNKDQFVFVNVSHLEFSNLTNAIKQREKRLKMKDELRNQCLIMDSEKADRYKRHETSPKVGIIQGSMNEAWQNIASSLRIKTNEERIRQHERNEKVFHILYPSLQGKFDSVLTQNNFRQLKRELFKFEQRRPLVKNTTHTLKFKSNRSVTSTTQFGDHLSGSYC